MGEFTISSESIGAAYFRRPGMPMALANVTENAHRKYCESEWSASLKSLYSMIDSKWFNPPNAIEQAENKPLQLKHAMQLGFNVPETCVTNDIRNIKDMLTRGAIVVKTLRTGLIGEGRDEAVIFTTALDKTNALDELEIRAAPMIAQRLIPKSVDIRATVVGEKVFAAEIHSQAEQETQVDWRRGLNVLLKHTVASLPTHIERQCVALVKKLGLRFGAIDLIRDQRDNYWFLEINPNGQWAWIEYRTGLPIAAAIVDELEIIRSQQ